MCKESPVNGFTELECYKAALRLREVVGQKGRLTARTAGKRCGLSEGQTIKIAQVYGRNTFVVEPYGQTARIMMRPLKQAS